MCVCSSSQPFTVVTAPTAVLVSLVMHTLNPSVPECGQTLRRKVEPSSTCTYMLFNDDITRILIIQLGPNRQSICTGSSICTYVSLQYYISSCVRHCVLKISYCCMWYCLSVATMACTLQCTVGRGQLYTYMYIGMLQFYHSQQENCDCTLMEP